MESVQFDSVVLEERGTGISQEQQAEEAAEIKDRFGENKNHAGEPARNYLNG